MTKLICEKNLKERMPSSTLDRSRWSNKNRYNKKQNLANKQQSGVVLMIGENDPDLHVIQILKGSGKCNIWSVHITFA